MEGSWHIPAKARNVRQIRDYSFVMLYKHERGRNATETFLCSYIPYPFYCILCADGCNCSVLFTILSIYNICKSKDMSEKLDF